MASAAAPVNADVLATAARVEVGAAVDAGIGPPARVAVVPSDTPVCGTVAPLRIEEVDAGPVWAGTLIATASGLEITDGYRLTLGQSRGADDGQGGNSNSSAGKHCANDIVTFKQKK